MLGVHVDLQDPCNKFAAHSLATSVLNHLFNFAKASLIFCSLICYLWSTSYPYNLNWINIL
jgi:hypothetical protein